MTTVTFPGSNFGVLAATQQDQLDLQGGITSALHAADDAADSATASANSATASAASAVSSAASAAAAAEAVGIANPNLYAPKADPSFTGTITSAGNLTLSGTSTTTATITGKSVKLLTPNNVPMSGTLNAQTVLEASAFVNGVNGSTQGHVNYLSCSDTVNYYGPNKLALLNVVQSAGGAKTAGNRAAIRAYSQANSVFDPGGAASDNPTVAGLITVGALAIGQGGFARAVNTGAGSSFGLNAIGQASGTAVYHAVNGGEFGVKVATGSTVNHKRGLSVVGLDGDVSRGVYDDAALSVNAQPAATARWLKAIEIGAPTADYPLDTDSTVLRLSPRVYSGTSAPVFYRGIDFRHATITAGGGAFLSPDFVVQERGDTYARSLTTFGTIQAKTATVASMTITDGGTYAATAFPVLTIAAPLSGVTATAAVSTMAGRSIVGFGTTGRNYTAASISALGGTGTSPTWTATVDGSGSITALALATNGSWTAAPANPVQLTGNTGTGAYINILTYTNSAGVFIPLTWEFAASGWGNSAAAVLTVSGDTGTAVQITVGTVTADGGVLKATVTAPGNITALAGTTYHTTSAGNCSLLVGYTITGVTITNAGSGYVVSPAPIVVAGQTPYLYPSLAAVMTTANATLALNPSGGSVTIGGNALALGGALTLSGAFGTTLTVTGTTAVTLPTSGTLVNSGVTTLSSLASVGTITTGVWSGTAIDAATKISGNLPVANLGSGTSASSQTFWRGDGAWKASGSPKAVSLRNPMVNDEVTLFYTTTAITIAELDAVLRGSSTPSVTWTIRSNADRSATGTEVVTSGTTTTTTTTAQAITSLTSATIAAGLWVWLKVTAVSGTVDELAVSVKF